MDEKVLKEVYENLRQGRKVALATVVEFRGVVNKQAGTLMAVCENGRVIGSISEGPLEYKIIEKSLQCIEDEKDKELDFFLNDTDNLNNQTPGTARIYIKVFIPRPRLVIIGLGEIGAEIFKISKLMNFYISLFDDKSDSIKNKIFEEADEINLGNYEETLPLYNFDGNTYVCIVTKSQRVDEIIIEHLLETKSAYIGVEGNAVKLESMRKNLSLKGVDVSRLDKIFCPMGIDITSEEPSEIAFGIMSEILCIKNKGKLEHKKNMGY